MALYLGNSGKLKITTSTGVCNLIITATASTPAIDGIRLLSLDNYVLKDSSGLYLIAKEDE